MLRVKTKAPALGSGWCEAGPLESGSSRTAFRRLEFGVGVRADFAVEVDFFVLWGYPFHGRGSLEKTSRYAMKDSTEGVCGEWESVVKSDGWRGLLVGGRLESWLGCSLKGGVEPPHSIWIATRGGCDWRRMVAFGRRRDEEIWRCALVITWG